MLSFPLRSRTKTLFLKNGICEHSSFVISPRKHHVQAWTQVRTCAILLPVSEIYVIICTQISKGWPHSSEYPQHQNCCSQLPWLTPPVPVRKEVGISSGANHPQCTGNNEKVSGARVWYRPVSTIMKICKVWTAFQSRKFTLTQWTTPSYIPA